MLVPGAKQALIMGYKKSQANWKELQPGHFLQLIEKFFEHLRVIKQNKKNFFLPFGLLKRIPTMDASIPFFTEIFLELFFPNKGASNSNQDLILKKYFREE